MSVGFGFSAGDFIAAINLVSTVIDAFRETGDASSEYRELIGQLYTLETALLRVKRLDLDETQQAEIIALRQAAAQCHRTIDDFWKRIEKYQPSLRTGGSVSRLKDGWMKIKWALCKKEDVFRFKTDLMAHTQSIELILTTLLTAETNITTRRNDQNHRSLIGMVQDTYFGYMQRLAVVLETVSSGVQQGKQLLEMTAQIIQTNVRVFQIVLNIQDIITRIPNQVDRQQPVFLVDALGRDCTFHLESTRSAEALRAVLKINFEQADSVASKIDEGAFAIRDSATGREIDLSSSWDGCFSPGQRAEMSVILFSYETSLGNCPKCHHACDGRLEEDVKCSSCGIAFRCSIRKPQLQSKNVLVADKYEELPFHDRLREFQKVVPVQRFNNRQLDSLRHVLIHTLVPKFLPKSIRGDEEDKKNEKKIRIKIEEGEEGEWNEEGMNDKNKTRIPLQNSAIEPKKDIKYVLLVLHGSIRCATIATILQSIAASSATTHMTPIMMIHGWRVESGLLSPGLQRWSSVGKRLGSLAFSLFEDIESELSHVGAATETRNVCATVYLR